MIDLNSKEFKGNTYFNNGIAGKVNNVSIKIVTKEPNTRQPDYQLVMEDTLGSINEGFYYPTPNPQWDTKRNDEYINRMIARLMYLGRAVMGQDYVFPEVNTVKEAYDSVFGLISQNSEGKKFNVYVTYGTTNKPSKYLGLRFYDFIEPVSNEVSILMPKASDMLERVKPDAPKDNSGLDSLTGNETVNSNFTL